MIVDELFKIHYNMFVFRDLLRRITSLFKLSDGMLSFSYISDIAIYFAVSN